MMKAGFDLRHLECRECGRQEVVTLDLHQELLDAETIMASPLHPDDLAALEDASPATKKNA
jgi:hypothetical protein